MKSNFKLNKAHELILQMLYENRNSFPFSIKNLDYAIQAFKSQSLHDFVSATGNILYSPELLSFTSRELSVFEKDVHGLEFAGLIRVGGSMSNRDSSVQLTDEGIQIAKRLKEGRRVIVRPGLQQRSTIFIASAFGYEDTDSLFKNCFVPACENFGYNPNRVDLSEPSDTITATIMDGITETACIIADLTYARPSVYFEVGYAHGLGIPLLLTCRSDHYHGKNDNARVHFDLEQFKISYWKRSAKGKFSWKPAMNPAERLSKILKPYKNSEE